MYTLTENMLQIYIKNSLKYPGVNSHITPFCDVIS